MIVRTDKDTFVTKRGKFVSTASCFIDPLHIPRGGWRVVLKVNNVEHTIKGDNSRQVFQLSKRYLRLNKVELSDRDLWFTLNYQWASRTEDDRLIVNKNVILQAKLPDDEEADDDHYFPPQEWGSIEWLSLGLHLSLPSQQFNYEFFLKRLEHTMLLLNSVRVPHLGCQECYGHFSVEVAQMRNKNLSLQECREWLHNFHNEVNHRLGKPILTYEQAAKINRWI